MNTANDLATEIADDDDECEFTFELSADNEIDLVDDDTTLSAQEIQAYASTIANAYVSETEMSMRKIGVWGVIDELLARQTIESLIHLSTESTTLPIELWINSPGGDFHQALAIYDVMQYLPCPVYTIGVGLVASGAVLVFTGGTKGKRLLLPNTRCMLHQVIYEGKGSMADMSVLHKEASLMEKKWVQLISKHCKLSAKDLNEQLKNNLNLYMSPTQAIKIGIADGILK